MEGHWSLEGMSGQNFLLFKSTLRVLVLFVGNFSNLVCLMYSTSKKIALFDLLLTALDTKYG